MTCLFCQIAKGEEPAHIIHRDADIMAFLDTGPIRPGHTQIIPIDHYDSFDDLRSGIAHQIIDLGQSLSRIMKARLLVNRVAFLFTGGDIAHAHAHLVPLHDKHDITSRRYIATSDLTFSALPHPGEPALAEMAARLRADLALTKR